MGQYGKGVWSGVWKLVECWLAAAAEPPRRSGFADRARPRPGQLFGVLEQAERAFGKGLIAAGQVARAQQGVDARAIAPEQPRRLDRGTFHTGHLRRRV